MQKKHSILTFIVTTLVVLLETIVMPAYAIDVGLRATYNQIWAGDSELHGKLESNNYFGRSFASGDFNNDGYVDLAIGVPEEGINDSLGIHQAAAGVVHVIYGTEYGPSSSLVGNQLWEQDSPGISGNVEYADRFGTTLASGDFNGDGFADLAIGVPNEDYVHNLIEREDAGVVHVIYGTEYGLSSAGDQLWTQDSSGIQGSVETSNYFGRSLCSGDFNGDGYADLAIGVPGEDNGSGVVNVIYGGTSGLSAAGNQMWSQNSPGIEGGIEADDGFGSKLISGDFNGDGYADLAIGAPGEDFGDTNDGAVHILYGSESRLSSAGSQLWGQNQLSEAQEANDRFGDALSSGDFNGDGYADLAVGVSAEDYSGATDTGVVHILYGDINGLSSAGNQLWSQNSPGIEGSVESDDRFGGALSSSDYNGDGIDDLTIGVSRKDYLGKIDAGIVHVLYGDEATGLSSVGSQLWTQNSECILDTTEQGDRFGDSLSSGDFNGDGYADLAIGAPYEDYGEKTNAGVVHVLYSNLIVPTELDFDGDSDIDGTDLCQFVDDLSSSGSSSDVWLSMLSKSFGQILPTDLGITDTEKLSMLTKYAPRVWLESDELYMPSSVEWAFPYLYRSETYTPFPFAPPVILGGGYWLLTKDSICDSERLPFFSGNLASAPVYAFWDRKDVCGNEADVDLIYYLYYPYNRGKLVHGTTYGHHVGDWEHITVRLSWDHDSLNGWTLKPSLIYISAHNFGGAYEWDDISKVEDTHPIVYAARGSHGMWKDPGDHVYNEVCILGICDDLVDSCSAGTAWDTWEQMETFDYYDPSTNSGRGLGTSEWPIWMSNDFYDPGTGDPSDPASGPIYRWGNPTCGEVFGFDRLTNGPLGPVSKSVWSLELN